MQVQDFCRQMKQQIETFRESVSKIEQKLDAGGTAAKGRILPIVGDIKQLVMELSIENARLDEECPSDWSGDKSRMEGLMGRIGSQIDQIWSDIFK